jgi:transcriptional regulator with XRE-family HTH domain
MPISESTGCSVPVQTLVNRSPVIVGIALAGLAIGTGGSLTGLSWVDLGRRARVTSVSCEVSRISEVAAERDQEPLTLQETLAAIQHYFSLNIKELAQILGVSRPTIYSWLRAEQEPQATNLARIAELHSLTRLWQKISIRPIGAPVRTPVVGERSLLQLFAEDELNRELIAMSFEKIGRLSTRAQEAKKQTARSHNLEQSTDLQQELLSQEFGI